MKRTIVAKGNTYPVKEELKAMGAKWDGSNWSFKEMPTEKIEGITFELKIKVTSNNEIPTAVEEMRKAYMPTAKARAAELAKMNKKTFEQVISDGTSLQHLNFKDFAKNNIGTLEREEFENGKTYRAYRDAFREELQKELDRVGTVENFWR
jgi:hypothetical protein